MYVHFVLYFSFFFFFKQKTAYEMRISDWSSDVCSSDLLWPDRRTQAVARDPRRLQGFADPQQRLHRHARQRGAGQRLRSEEHTSELQSLMRISYAVFCLKKKKDK